MNAGEVKCGVLMIYNDMTNLALHVMWDAHRDQTDKAGIPYVFHPFHLAEQFNDEVRCTVALLHDVMEDSEVYTDEKLSDIFPDRVMIPLRLLTRRKCVKYSNYIDAISKNEIACDVKIADLEHNLDSGRFYGSQFYLEESLVNRYIKAVVALRKCRQRREEGAL